MNNLMENNLVRFQQIKRKKDGLFANFKVKGVRGGTSYTTSISVDILEAEVVPSDSLEKIIEAAGKLALREFQQSDFQFEGLKAI